MPITVIESKPIYHMSSAGKCPRALSAARLGYTPEPAPEWLERAADEGRWHEKRIKNELVQKGFLVEDEQREVELDYPTFTLLGHIDGRVVATMDKHYAFAPMDDNISRLLEIKSMSQFEFDRWMKEGFKGFPEYADQITCYMEATELEEVLYIVKNRSSGYEDRRVITEQPSSLNDIVTKLQEVTQAKELYPKEFDPNSLECRRCEYKALCAPEQKELVPIQKARLEHAAQIWREGKRLSLQGNLMIDDAKGVFEQHTRATGIDKWRFAELAINLVEVAGRLDYPKGKLLEIFTEEQLKPASVIKLPYEYIRIEDLRKEES